MTWIFLAVVAVQAAMRLWLSRRQERHVLAHKGAVPDAFRESIPADAHEKAADYTVAGTRFGRIQTVAGALLLLAWTLGGGIELLASAFDHQSIFGGAAFLVSAFLIAAIPMLPLDLYDTFVLEERFGFNRTTTKLWVIDLVKGALLAVAIGGPAVLGALWIMENGGAYWWLALWAGWVAFSLLLAWAGPAFLAKLFFKFTPLPEGDLKERVEDLLQRTGYASEGVYVMDGSRRSAHANAFFAGFGKTKRVVLFDTLCEKLSVAELEAVLAHEIGHFKKRHITRRMVISALEGLVILALFAWIKDRSWFQAGLGVSDASNATALLLLVWAGPAFAFPLRPLWSYWSRRQEYEADAFAVQETSADAMRAALVRLYETNASTLTPDPVHSAYYDSHPPASLRIGRLK
ncbi:MAG: M48 family metallopeptidase [Planctomycetota bacterium]|jgi:STE24 endopeptidase